MNAENYTDKSREALTAAHDSAIEANHQTLEPAHLLTALTKQADGLVPALLAKMELPADRVQAIAASAMEQLPAVTGPGVGQVGMGRKLSKLLIEAAKLAKNMKDEFVSVEHLLLALLVTDKDLAAELKPLGLSREAVMKALQAVRGSQRVTSATPESTFEALEKYGRDLTELARQDKLDPVIGRDEEIRRAVQILSRERKTTLCSSAIRE